MGIFSRITDIVNANINSMLDKAENPEKMVKLMIHEMEDTLTEVKSAAAEVVADQLRLKRNLDHEQKRRDDWESKATLAVEKGREDLAKEALEQKLDYDKRVEGIEKRLHEVQEIVKQYQLDITRLEEKLASARARQRSLITSHTSAMNRRKVEEKIYKLNTTGAFAKFENYEQRIDRFQAEAEVIQQSNRTLEDKFRDLQDDRDVEDELAKLKAKMKGEKAETPPASNSKPSETVKAS